MLVRMDQHQELPQTEHQLINAPTGGGAGLQPRESRPGGCDLILPKTKKLKCIYVVKQIHIIIPESSYCAMYLVKKTACSTTDCGRQVVTKWSPSAHQVVTKQASTTCGASSQPDLIQNHFLTARMLRFLRHSRQKVPYFKISRQKVPYFNILRQKVTYFDVL